MLVQLLIGAAAKGGNRRNRRRAPGLLRGSLDWPPAVKKENRGKSSVFEEVCSRCRLKAVFLFRLRLGGVRKPCRLFLLFPRPAFGFGRSLFIC